MRLQDGRFLRCGFGICGHLITVASVSFYRVTLVLITFQEVIAELTYINLQGNNDFCLLLETSIT